MKPVYVRGFYGQYFNYYRPEDYTFTIPEFAHSLSKICRFSGHVRSHYSVAQHSVLVSYAVPNEGELQYQALLHDAAESFMSDVPSPLKRIIGPIYMEIEANIERAIFRQFGLPEEMDSRVRDADRLLLSVERRDLIPKDDDDKVVSIFWPDWVAPNPDFDRIVPLADYKAQLQFKLRALELQEQL